MKIFFATFVFAFLLYADNVNSMEIYCVTPSDLSPGSEITVKGADFGDETVVVLGDRAIRPFYTSPSLIKFTVPENIEPGTYRLHLKTKKNMTYPIGIALRKKAVGIKNFTPESIDLCGPRGKVIVVGDNMGEIKKININGLELKDFQAADRQLVFDLPEEAVKTAPNFINVYFYDATNKIQDLINIKVKSTPFIEKAEIQNSSLNTYEIRITGKNFINGLRFFANGGLIIEKNKDNTSASTNEIQPVSKRPYNAAPMYDRVEYMGCGELLYLRYPVSSDAKRMEMYIENPTGERSNTYIITAP